MSKKSERQNERRNLKREKRKVTAIVLCVCVVLVFSVRWGLGKWGLTADAKNINPRAQGNPQAAVHVVEYTDFQCPACRRGDEVLKDFLKRYPQQLYVEHRHYPLLRMHQHALKAAIFAECAARQNKFWSFYDLLFERQKQWSKLINPSVDFWKMSEEIKLDYFSYKHCVEDKSIEEEIMSDVRSGSALGVRSTPTFFINGKMVVGMTELTRELNNQLGNTTPSSGGGDDQTH